MTLGVVVNGTLFQRAKAISVRRSLRSFAGWFDIVSSSDPNERIPIRINDRVQIVSGTSDVLLTGFIESLRVQQDAGSHEITVGGRDITADLIDSTLKTKQFNGPIRFLDLVSNLLREQGLSSIRVVNEAGQVGEINETELISGEIGESSFAFLERYARRVQVLLTTNEDGAILVMRAGATDSGVSLIRSVSSPLNNILASSVEVNVAGRFGEYACQSQLAPGGPNFDGTTQEATSQSGTATDSGIRSTRFFETEADRRAVEGVTVGVFRHRGKNYLKKRFSDTLLLARLKALDQETYGDKSKIDGDMRHEHSGPGGTPLNVTIDWGVPPDEDPES